VQQTAVHITNIIHAISMFQLDKVRNDSNEEHKRMGQILHHMVQIFCNDNQAGDASLNILDSPPRAIHGHILIAGQHDAAPQVFTAEQVIIHSMSRGMSRM
jgi:hypothetical protein